QLPVRLSALSPGDDAPTQPDGLMNAPVVRARSREDTLEQRDRIGHRGRTVSTSTDNEGGGGERGETSQSIDLLADPLGDNHRCCGPQNLITDIVFDGG